MNLHAIEPSVELLRERFAVPGAMGGGEGAAAHLIDAAVLVPVVQRAEGLTMLLTRRTDHLRDHPGQVSFPGGRCEASDESAVYTALREAEEEIGLVASVVDVLGSLPRYATGTGFSVTPVVGLVSAPFDLQVDEFEVAEVFEAPLRFLLDPANRSYHEVDWKGRRRRYWSMPYEGYNIWGATAGMIVSLHRFLAGLPVEAGDG